MILAYLLCVVLGIMIGAVGMALVCRMKFDKYMNEEMDDDYEYL